MRTQRPYRARTKKPAEFHPWVSGSWVWGLVLSMGAARGLSTLCRQSFHRPGCRGLEIFFSAPVRISSMSLRSGGILGSRSDGIRPCGRNYRGECASIGRGGQLSGIRALEREGAGAGEGQGLRRGSPRGGRRRVRSKSAGSSRSNVASHRGGPGSRGWPHGGVWGGQPGRCRRVASEWNVGSGEIGGRFRARRNAARGCRRRGIGTGEQGWSSLLPRSKFRSLPILARLWSVAGWGVSLAASMGRLAAARARTGLTATGLVGRSDRRLEEEPLLLVAAAGLAGHLLQAVLEFQERLRRELPDDFLSP